MLYLESPSNSTVQSSSKTSCILIIEDEDSIRNLVTYNLKQKGYKIIEIADARKAIKILNKAYNFSFSEKIDLIILGKMLPEFNSLDVCRLLRHRGDTTPIIIISDENKESDKVLGLEMGADDYIVKPFGMKELVARCRALLRRHNFNNSSVETENNKYYHFKDVLLYPQECRVTVRGKEINLSPKEFKLLELFMSYPRRVWDREQLIENIWGADFLGDTKTVDVHIRWLREKLEEDPSNPEYLITIRGFGYRFG